MKVVASLYNIFEFDCCYGVDRKYADSLTCHLIFKKGGKIPIFKFCHYLLEFIAMWLVLIVLHGQ